MEHWETAVESFTKKWSDKDNVEGFLVCGSYVTGSPSKRSDIDLHIARARSMHESKHMQDSFKEIVDYIHEKTGGFKLDGWRVNTPTST